MAETVVQSLHIGGVLMAGGLAIAADRGTLRALRAPAPDRAFPMRELAAVHQWVLTGLTIVVISGVGMLAADIETFFGSWIYWTKMALFVVLLVNGLVIVRTEAELRADPHEQSPHWGSFASPRAHQHRIVVHDRRARCGTRQPDLSRSRCLHVRTIHASTPRAGDDPCAGCTAIARRDFLRDAGARSRRASWSLSARRRRARSPRRSSSSRRPRGGREDKTYPIPAQDGVQIDKDDEAIMTRWQGKVYAFALACPHQNTALQWSGQGQAVRVPQASLALHTRRHLHQGQRARDARPRSARRPQGRRTTSS